jgi:Bles03-like protein
MPRARVRSPQCRPLATSVDPCATAERWVRAEPEEPADYDIRHVGKWLIYLRCRQVETSWAAVARGTRAAVLGVGAKISGHEARRTKRPDEELELADLLDQRPPHVVCVYTRDWRDVADNERVGRKLAELGVIESHVLRYKSDEQTYAGVYAGAGPVSLFKMAPPYAKLEADAGLARWATREPEAGRVLARLSAETRSAGRLQPRSPQATTRGGPGRTHEPRRSGAGGTRGSA